MNSIVFGKKKGERAEVYCYPESMPAGIFTCSHITFAIVYSFYFLCVVPHGINVIVFGKEMGKGTESYDLF